LDIKAYTKNIYLFSIDLEDVRIRMPDGLRYSERVPVMTEKYLDFLEEHNCKTTFFVVGDVAKTYPYLIEKIILKGHEIACHSNKHIPLDKLSPKTFKKDLEENMKALFDAGVKNIYGYRAPVYSLTENSKWAYQILADMGFVYSSSVLPVKNPLYGWPSFGRDIKILNENICELPITLFKSSIFSFPFTGGIYFRIIPFFITSKLIKKVWNSGQPVIAYFHPYDIDIDQERFMHPGINNNKIYNKLMYVNRSSLLTKVDKIISLGGKIIPYIDFVKEKYPLICKDHKSL
jgi:polysaccharide deacetylase family protein (PEP-CTERM system associated)